MKHLLERSKIGTLRTPNICIVALRDRMKRSQNRNPMMVAADAKGRCYASQKGTTFERMLNSGYLEIIGNYTRDCPEGVIWDDIQIAAKECGISC